MKKFLSLLLASVILTLILMLLIALAAVYLKPSDITITWLNQFTKIAAIIFGVRVAVGWGGKNGFITGMALAIIYMLLGYGMYVGFGGNAFNTVSMLGEVLIGAAVGAVSGAVFANLSPKRKHKKH